MTLASKFSFSVDASADLGSKSIPMFKFSGGDEDDAAPDLDISDNDVAVAVREAVEAALQEVQGLAIEEASRRAEKYLSKVQIKTDVEVEHDVHERDVPDHRGEHTTVPDRVYFNGQLSVVISSEDDAAFTALGLDQAEWESALREAVDNLGVELESLKLSEEMKVSLSLLSQSNQERLAAWQTVVSDIKTLLSETQDVLEPGQQVDQVERALKHAGFTLEQGVVSQLVQDIKDGREVSVDKCAPRPYQEKVKSETVSIPTQNGSSPRPAVK